MTQMDRLHLRYGPRYRLWVTLTVMLGLVALGMSITIVNVAIPFISDDIGLSDAEAQWLSTGFLASTTVSLLVAPWLVHAIGQRATYAGLLLTFIAALAGIMGIMAIGMAAFPPPTLANAIAALPTRLTGYGSGMLNFVMQLGGALGTAGLVILLEHQTGVHGRQIAAGAPNGEVSPGVRASILAYQDGFWMMVISLVIIIVPTLLVSRWRHD